MCELRVNAAITAESEQMRTVAAASALHLTGVAFVEELTGADQ